MFSALLEFGWNPILEEKNIIGLNKGGKNITLEPGNQIELSGDKLNNIHEACAESQDYLFELRQVTQKLGIKIVSAGFDPISKLNEIPNNPKQRYEVNDQGHAFRRRAEFRYDVSNLWHATKY